jgi:hippurate hydrolase
MNFMSEVIGSENVLSTPPVMGGEDFGRYGRTSEKVPGLIYWLGAADPIEFENARQEGRQMPSLHSPFFKPNSTIAIPVGVKTMTKTVTSLFNE